MSTKSTFKDHFSSSSSGYATFRPGYPETLFEWLAARCAHRRRAWDCGTGNGQAAVGLATHFDVVAATDPSEAQIAHRASEPGVHYGVMTAESSALADGSVDLITVAQALHWFDLERFYAEVRRALAPDGMLAVWTYSLPCIDTRIDERVRRFHAQDVGRYWPPERAFVDRGYAGIDFPFAEVTAPAFEMSAEWTRRQLAGYLETWSAVAEFRRQNGYSPVPAFIESISELWGVPEDRRRVRWPLELRVGRLEVYP